LPFAEDLRQFTFGSLPVEEVDAGSQPPNRKFTPSGNVHIFICMTLCSSNPPVLNWGCRLTLVDSYNGLNCADIIVFGLYDVIIDNLCDEQLNFSALTLLVWVAGRASGL